MDAIFSIWKEFSDTPLFHYVLPCQMPFCQTAPLLPPVAWQQYVTEYYCEGPTSTAIPPTFVSDVMDKHNKIGGIPF